MGWLLSEAKGAVFEQFWRAFCQSTFDGRFQKCKKNPYAFMEPPTRFLPRTGSASISENSALRAEFSEIEADPVRGKNRVGGSMKA